jgi:hypothetical protein
MKRNRIRYYIRRHRFYQKYFRRLARNIRHFYWKHTYIKYELYWKYKYYSRNYSFRKDKEVEGNTLYCILDRASAAGGLVDRLKNIVGCYYIAKVNGFDFKIITEAPFLLSDCLEVNTHDWLAGKEELSYSLKNSRVILYVVNGRSIPTLNKSIKQYHVCLFKGLDILEYNDIQDYAVLWGKLFNSLFKPKDSILQSIKDTGFAEDEYIAVHLRFINALEHLEDTQYNAIPPEKQEKLIQRCFAGIREILSESEGKPVVIFSDSNVFLNRVKELPVHVLDGKVGHIAYSKEADILHKAFVDFYMISRARRVYAIRAREMYDSVYSHYAARAGYKEVIKVEV